MVRPAYRYGTIHSAASVLSIDTGETIWGVDMTLLLEAFLTAIVVLAIVVVFESVLIRATVKILHEYKSAVINVQYFAPVIIMLAQTTLRAVLGQHPLDEMLSTRKRPNFNMRSILDGQTEA